MTDTAHRAPAPFDPQAHMRKIRTRQGPMDYLDVKWRVAWLRASFPAAQLVTEEVESGIKHARFRCTITLPNGAIGTGHGSETFEDFPDFYEKAETKAIGRACAMLGFGTEMADLVEPAPDRTPRVQLGDRLSAKQQAWMSTEALQRGIRLSETPQLWSTVISQLAKAGVDMEQIGDDAGIIAEDVARKLLAVPLLVRQPEKTPAKEGDG